MTGIDSAGACSACGTALTPGAPFCGTCGASIPPEERAAVAVAARVATAEVPPASAAEASSPVPAAPGRRVVALVVDQVLVAGVVVAAYVFLAAGASSAATVGSETATAVALLGLLVVPFAASAVVGLAQLIAEGRSGATVGNLALGIRTVRVATAQPPGFGRAVLRRLIESLGGILVVGQYVIAASPAWDSGRYRQGWQDKAAGTTMVTAASLRKRGPVAPAARPVLGPDRPGGEAAPAWPRVPAPAAPRPAGLISDVPGFAPAALDHEAGAVGPMPVLATAPVAATEPSLAPEPDESLDRTRLSAAKPLYARAYRLAFDTGESLVVAGAGLIGRNPTPGPGEVADHVIPITDPDRSVSKTHLAFGIGPDGFWVLDRGSTNGTAVTADGDRTEATPGAPVAVPVGGTVEFGDRSFTVSAAGGSTVVPA